MKKTLLIVVLLGTLLSLAAYVTCVAIPLVEKPLVGSGNIVTKTMPAPDFDGIAASRAVHVIVSDKTDRITIAADDNIIDRVEVKTVKGKLKVGIDSSIKSISNLNVTVTVPANGKICSFDASSASRITTAVALSAPKFSIDASSAAKIEAAVKADKCVVNASSASKIKAALSAGSCSVDLSSAAKIELSGSADNFNADLSSASKLDASKFKATNCTVDTSSGAKAEVNCTGKLVASASSGSSIRYSGDCQTELSQSSGGSVRKD